MSEPKKMSLAHLDAPVAAVTSFATTLSLAAGVAPVPDSAPSWLPYVTTIIGPVLIMLLGRGISAVAAAMRTKAALKEKRAQALLADKNPANDKEAQKLLDEAVTDRAVADGLEAFKTAKKD